MISETYETMLNDEKATIAAGKRLGALLTSGGVVYLEGTLGAGKTTFCRGVLLAHGHSGPVKSPTYTLVEPYDLHDCTIYHFDLYRLGDPEELEFMGIRDYFANENLSLIEWPEKGRGYIPEADLVVSLTLANASRLLKLSSVSPVGDQILSLLDY